MKGLLTFFVASQLLLVSAWAQNDTINALIAELDALKAQVASMEDGGDRAWALSSAVVVLTMQAGFAMLEAGAVPSHSQINILMKNLVDMAVGSVAFFTIGWGIAYGGTSSPAPVTGTGEFFLVGLGDRAVSFTFQYAFAAAASTILSGAVAGRLKFLIYVCISALVTGIVYPLGAHAVWDDRGWLWAMGAHDFAGSGVVHAVGGAMGLVATIFLGPRIGVFSEEGKYLPTRSNPASSMLGCFILVWAWFAFNAGSSGGMSGGSDLLAGTAATNTAVASGTGGVLSLLVSYYRSGWHYVDIYDVMTGVLAALVSVTAPCACIDPWVAAIVGIIGAAAALATMPLLEWGRVDDPVGVIPVHLVGGWIGMIAVGLFAHGGDVHYAETFEPGLFMGGTGRLLGVQLLTVTLLTVWAMLSGVAILTAFHYSFGLRVDKEHEIQGLDAVEHNLVQVRVVPFEEPDDDQETPGIRKPRNRRVSITRHASHRTFLTNQELQNLHQDRKDQNYVFQRPESFIRTRAGVTEGNNTPIIEGNGLHHHVQVISDDIDDNLAHETTA